MKILKGFALAFNMLTIIPFFKVHHFFKGINGYSATFYPLVGFILGLTLFGVYTLLKGTIPSTHLSVIIFSLWVTLTGALHLDGLSDTIDGLFVPKERALEVMKDSHIGGMGMIFSFLFLTLKLSSVIYFEAFYLLPIILMLSRLNAIMAIYFYDYISSGIGQLIKEEFHLKHLLFALFYTTVITYSFSFMGAFIALFVVLIITAHFFVKRLGGLNGDIYGFIIEVSELVVLNYVIFTMLEK